MNGNRGRIINQENSGTKGVGFGEEVGDNVGFGETDVEVEVSGMVIVCVLLQSLV
jgi:hypothetical protein